jgi:glycogen operon protein
MLTIEGLTDGQWTYHYRIDGIDIPDPCGTNFIGAEKWGDVSRLSTPYQTLITEDDFDWEDDVHPHLPWNELFIYRLHVRGFTIHKSSKVKNKGTFDGILEKLPYLQSLGVTAIELMPAYEFEEIELAGGLQQFPTGRTNYWGYNRSYYYAPKASFAGKAFAPTAFKELVKVLHKVGIEVFMEFYFTPEMSTQQVLDILRYWRMTYHIDGFRILGNVHLPTIANEPLLANTRLFADSWVSCDSEPTPNFRQYLHSVSTGKIIETNPKATSSTSLVKKRKSYGHLAYIHNGFQVDIRRFLRGDEGMIGSFTLRMRENPQDIHIVHYLASNNGFTLKDTFTYEQKHNEINGEQNRDGINDNYSFNCGEEGPSSNRLVNQKRKTQIFNALTLLFLSQGVPLVQAGDEMGHTQYGNNNAWCQDNTISWIDWKDLRKNKDIFDFFNFLVKLRQNHFVFRNPLPLTQSDTKGYGLPDISFHGLEPWRPNFDPFCRQSAVLYEGRYAKQSDGTADETFYLLCNMYWIPSEFWLPSTEEGQEWRLVFSTASKNKKNLPSIEKPLPLKSQKRLMVESRGIVLLVSRKVENETE